VEEILELCPWATSYSVLQAEAEMDSVISMFPEIAKVLTFEAFLHSTSFSALQEQDSALVIELEAELGVWVVTYPDVAKVWLLKVVLWEAPDPDMGGIVKLQAQKERSGCIKLGRVQLQESHTIWSASTFEATSLSLYLIESFTARVQATRAEIRRMVWVFLIVYWGR